MINTWPQMRPKDDAESALCSNMSTGLVDIYEVKRSQRHFLTATLMKTADWSKESESLDISILSIFPQKKSVLY